MTFPLLGDVTISGKVTLNHREAADVVMFIGQFMSQAGCKKRLSGKGGSGICEEFCQQMKTAQLIKSFNGRKTGKPRI